jgi:hypothetical protein
MIVRNSFFDEMAQTLGLPTLLKHLILTNVHTTHEREIPFFKPVPPHVSYGLRCLPSRLWPDGTPMGGSYVVPIRGLVIYEYEVPGWVLNLRSTNYPDHGHHGNLPLQGRIPTVEPGI